MVPTNLGGLFLSGGSNFVSTTVLHTCLNFFKIKHNYKIITLIIDALYAHMNGEILSVKQCSTLVCLKWITSKLRYFSSDFMPALSVKELQSHLNLV